ncbi:DNA cytosine methyltransferase [uncultured Draconibacterium sp.]|uniref:DNA cytosine methyltransferase n=1 Tax=uncultured Draconibacterium sp. TaxID=1573823 RepID=UPI0029C765CB|nr:DNA cytosine methyltransferase [uncultured Draconibacterium sp.]
MSNSKNNIKVVDFFCSVGGVSLGFKQAGIEVLGGIDIDQSCKETYEKNIGAKFLHEDVSELNLKKVGKYFGIRRGQRNLIFVGCSPCQYYSNIKTDKSKSSSTRLLLADFQEFVAYFRPGYIFIENVPGLDSNPESPLGQFKTFLNENGYVFDDNVLNAKYFGVPQNRRRYILVASRIKKKIKLPKEDTDNIITVRNAIGDYRKFPPIVNGTKDRSSYVHSAAALKAINLKRIQATPHDGGSRLDWNDDSLQLRCYRNHDGHTDAYGRLSWDEPSPTITTKFVSYSNGRYGHPEQDRAISLREGATLQSFPEDFEFCSESQVTIAKMIGNAVPPLLAKSIAKSFK